MKINPKIKVIGVGGSGCNAVSRMARCDIQGIELIAVNTDAQDLKFCLARYKLQIGEKIICGKNSRNKGGYIRRILKFSQLDKSFDWSSMPDDYKNASLFFLPNN